MTSNNGNEKAREFWLIKWSRGYECRLHKPDCDATHVISIDAYRELEAKLEKAEQKAMELEVEVHDLKNTSQVEALRALREVDKMKLDRANEKLEKAEAALERITNGGTDDKTEMGNLQRFSLCMKIADEALKEIRK